MWTRLISFRAGTSGESCCDAEMNLLVPWNARKLSSGYKTGGLPSCTQLHRVRVSSAGHTRSQLKYLHDSSKATRHTVCLERVIGDSRSSAGVAGSCEMWARPWEGADVGNVERYCIAFRLPRPKTGKIWHLQTVRCGCELGTSILQVLSVPWCCFVVIILSGV
jgi:hypothetical protein